MDPLTQCQKLRHDLKNHLSVLRLYSELLGSYLESKEVADQKTREYVATLVRRNKEMEENLSILNPRDLGLVQEP
jgi:hypothetical protein